jgi:hypothetical protein
MPNHVFHHVSFGPELTVEQLQKLEEITKVHNGICGYYCPMPEEIRNTTSPTKIVSEAEYKRIMKENESIDRTQPWYYEPKPITKKMQTKLLDAYGLDNWYDWAHEKWGTKWGCYDNELDGHSLHFTTAWCPLNTEIMLDFAKDFPNFTWHWEEEQGYGVTMEFVGGEIVEEDSYDYIEWTNICQYTDEKGITWDVLHTIGRPASLSTEEVIEGFYLDYSFEHHTYLGKNLPDYVIAQLDSEHLTNLYNSKK